MEFDMPEKTIFSICGMCSVHCPVQVNVVNGECSFIQGNPNVPGIKGALCARGAAGPEFVRDNERPQFPMIRKGLRGEGRWARVSWDEALNAVAEKITDIQNRHGRESFMWSDNGGEFSDLFTAFVRGLGSPNYHTSNAVCDINVHHACQSLFGFGNDAFVYDYKKTKYVVLQTRNLFESIDIQEVNNLLDSLEAGCKLAVIDIRTTISSAKADRFLMIRPGTDYALNLAVIHVLLNNHLYNASFAQTWIKDINALEAFVTPYTPEWAEAETGVKADTIVQFVKEMAQAAPSVIWHPGQMTARYADSFYVCRTAFIINALLGSIGAKGGLALAASPEDIGHKGLKKLTDLLPEVTSARADGAGGARPLFDPRKGLLHLALKAVETGEPYPVKAYMCFGHDPLASLPDPAALLPILNKLELIVCATSNWSQTAWNADIVLPISPYLEQESIIVQHNGLKPDFRVRFRCVDPRLDTQSDWEIISGLSKRLGISALSFAGIQDIWKYQLQDTDVSLDQFYESGIVELSEKPVRKALTDQTFTTASRRIEIINPRWEAAQISSLKPYEPRKRPESGRFRLTVGRCALHSQGHTINNPRLFSQMPENALWINTAAAQSLGVSDGDSVVVSANGTSAKITAKVTEHIHPEAVFMIHGFGRSIPAESRAFRKGVADNSLMAGGLNLWDAAGGGIAFQEHFISVKKA